MYFLSLNPAIEVLGSSLTYPFKDRLISRFIKNTRDNSFLMLSKVQVNKSKPGISVL